jgi:hypothetical protein
MLFVVAVLAVPIIALISGLFLAGDPHNGRIVRVMGLGLVLLAATDSVMTARSLNCGDSDTGATCDGGPGWVYVAYGLTLLVAITAQILRHRTITSSS